MARSRTPSQKISILAQPKIDFKMHMGTWPLGKEGGWAIDVAKESGGEGRLLARGSDTEANTLVDGGRRGTRHAGEHGSPNVARMKSGGVCLPPIETNASPPAKSARK
eukprot:11046305-Alexandrium_andersonii.AAC.1